jgi:Rieske Fe-S protein
VEPDLVIPSRRRVVQLGAVAGLGLVGAASLAACGSDDAAATTADPAASATQEPAPETTPAADGGGALAALADIPVGQALSVTGPDGTEVILVQATAGQVTGFKAACTHQGCPVKPNGASLDCPCHGSKYGLDGVPTNGPATNPLAAFAVKVDGDNVVAG